MWPRRADQRGPGDSQQPQRRILLSSVAGRVLRISAGVETTAEDWQALSDALLVTYKLLNEEADSMKSQVVSID